MDILELMNGQPEGKEEDISSALNGNEQPEAEETPPESSTGNEQPEPEDGDGKEQEGEGEETPKPAPFHKDPRWKRMYEENRQMRETVQKLQEQIAEGSKAKAEEPGDAPEWFTKVYGDDPKVYADYLKSARADRDSIKADVLDSIRRERERQDAESREYQDWVDSQLEEMEDEGMKFDRNRLMKVAAEWRPVKADGQIDFRKAYDIMAMQEGSQRKDRVERQNAKAAKSAPERKSDRDASRGYYTPDDLKAPFRGLR